MSAAVSKQPTDVERVRALVREAIDASRDFPAEGNLWEAQRGLLHALDALIRHEHGVTPRDGLRRDVTTCDAEKRGSR